MGNVVDFFISNLKSIHFGWHLGRIKEIKKGNNSRYVSVELIWKYNLLKNIIYSFQ